MYQYPNQTLFYAALFLTYFKLFSLILKDSCNIGKYKQSQNSVEKRTNLAVIFFFNEKWTPSRRLHRSVISAAPISYTSIRRISRHNLSNRYLCEVWSMSKNRWTSHSLFLVHLSATAVPRWGLIEMNAHQERSLGIVCESWYNLYRDISKPLNLQTIAIFIVYVNLKIEIFSNKNIYNYRQWLFSNIQTINRRNF